MTVSTKLKTLIPFTGAAIISLGCSSLDPQNQSTQSVTSAENVIEIQCGNRTLEVQIDKLTPEQKEEIQELKTRCRIDTVAAKMELRSGFTAKTLDDNLENHELRHVDNKQRDTRTRF